MNIFVLDCNPRLAAQYHCDKHVVKMCLEYAQLLSTAARQLCVRPSAVLYRSTHVNHPCARWVRQSSGNVRWMRRMLVCLGAEYSRRYHGRQHRSVNIGIRAADQLLACMPNKRRTPFALAMPDKYRSRDAVASYRRYYKGSKAAIATWKTNPPAWWRKRN